MVDVFAVTVEVPVVHGMVLVACVIAVVVETTTVEVVAVHMISKNVSPGTSHTGSCTGVHSACGGCIGVENRGHRAVRVTDSWKDRRIIGTDS